MGAPDPRRVAEVWTAASAAGPATSGSGYLVGSRALLTARHVIIPALSQGGTVWFRLLCGPGQAADQGWQRARVVWASEELDAALVATGIDGVPRSAPEVGWGRVESTWPLPCTAVGFPARELADGTQDSDQLAGTVVPLAQLKRGRIAVDVRGSGRGGTNSWGGFSGAGLFALNRLIGVVTGLSPSTAYEGRRLYAVPVAALWADAGFRAATRKLGLVGAMVPVPPARPPMPPDMGAAAGEGSGAHTVPDAWRLLILGRVHHYWIRGSLERSFKGTVRLDVECRHVPDLVPDPWAEEDGWPSEAIPDEPALTVDQVFADCLVPAIGKRLLIVGEPGSGKTTLLLELAERLHAHALDDPRALVPVPLLLQNWRDAEKPFAEWAAVELAQRYGIPERLVAQWLIGGGLFLLADGFDEIPEVNRERCRGALAEFVTDHTYARVGMALTSREAEYRDAAPLPVTAAVGMQPLTRASVLRRLAEAPGDYRALYDAVAGDDTLAELLATPLMLGVAATTLNAADPHDPGALPWGTPEERRNHLYKRYLEHLLRRPRAGRVKVSSGSARRSLAALRHLVPLARMMQSRGESVFFPDWITPEWAAAGYEARPALRQGLRHGLRTASAMLIAPVLFALVSLPLFGAAGLLTGRSTDFVLLTAGAGTVAFALGRGFQTDPERASAKWRWSWQQARIGAAIGLAIMLGVCLICGITIGTVSDTHYILYVVWGLGGATVSVIAVALASNAFEWGSPFRGALVLALGATVGVATGGVASPWSDAYSWEGIVQGRNEPSIWETIGHIGTHFPDPFFDGTNVGLVGGILGAMAGGWAGGVTFGFAYGLLGAIPGGLTMCLAFGLVRGLDSDETAAPSAPSQALRDSGRVAARLCACFMAIALLAVGLCWWLEGPWADVAALLLVAFVLLIGSGPGRTWLLHWSTRWELAGRRVLPWRLLHFLADASERALLSRAGGGFRFLHVSFRDYVAALGEDDATSTGLLGERTAPAWSPGTEDNALPNARTAHLGMLRYWWESSLIGQLTDFAVRWLGRALLRLLPSVGGGYALAAVVSLLLSIEDEDFWLTFLICCPVTGAVELLLRFGPRRVRTSLSAAGTRTLSAGNRLASQARQFLAGRPALRPVALWTGLSALAGFGVSRILAAIPGTPPTADDALGWALSAAGGAAALVYSLFRHGVIK
ncbi:NACHT domain-containing protein [Streptomyces chartreusis]|uniref:NACHT domain-containing protein n=1 Tax=Streptomyces chartreusis TaxID=1969 RepID=UPI00365B9E98